MRGGLIAANFRRQATALTSGEPAHGILAKAVEAERVRQLEAEPLAIVGKPGAFRDVMRNDERLLRWHEPVMPLTHKAVLDLDAENLRVLTGHARTLQSRRNGSSEHQP